jgi:inorganic pyrophosphatase
MAIAVRELPAVDPESGRVNVVIDTPTGSRNKYKFDEQHGQWRLSKVLPQGMCFPYDSGFVPSTRGEDGDPLDVPAIAAEPTFPGCVVPTRLIGVLEAEQTEGGKTVRNDRLVAVIETPYNRAEYHSLLEASQQRLDEIEHFFVSYNQMDGWQFQPRARHGADRARELVEQASRLTGTANNGAKQSRGRVKNQAAGSPRPAEPPPEASGGTPCPFKCGPQNPFARACGG